MKMWWIKSSSTTKSATISVPSSTLSNTEFRLRAHTDVDMFKDSDKIKRGANDPLPAVPTFASKLNQGASKYLQQYNQLKDNNLYEDMDREYEYSKNFARVSHSSSIDTSSVASIHNEQDLRRTAPSRESSLDNDIIDPRYTSDDFEDDLNTLRKKPSSGRYEKPVQFNLFEPVYKTFEVEKPEYKVMVSGTFKLPSESSRTPPKTPPRLFRPPVKLRAYSPPTDEKDKERSKIKLAFTKGTSIRVNSHKNTIPSDTKVVRSLTLDSGMSSKREVSARFAKAPTTPAPKSSKRATIPQNLCVQDSDKKRFSKCNEQSKSSSARRDEIEYNLATSLPPVNPDFIDDVDSDNSLSDSQTIKRSKLMLPLSRRHKKDAPSGKISKALSTESWYHGALSRDEATVVLKSAISSGASKKWLRGLFLVREKEAEICYVVSVVTLKANAASPIEHIRIEREITFNGVMTEYFRIGTLPQLYSTVEEAVDTLRTNTTISHKFSTLTTVLLSHAYPKTHRTLSG